MELVQRGDNIERKMAAIEEARMFHARANESGLFDDDEIHAISVSIQSLVTDCDNERTELAAAMHVWQNDIDLIKQEIDHRQKVIDECKTVMQSCPDLMETLAAGQVRRMQKLEAAQKSIGVHNSDTQKQETVGAESALERIEENSATEEKSQ